ncbi:hypothetical protein K1T71_008452 [Dendrolimus kikuchii]|uniref:Uncharacterized protein n=1 Tax=Dendrolimus kikuchii TaxID=765133 RepID=A0ACC1CY52_9NEOP|nr:hypothetical protein K1T71_008452 [Dendrolimus kikuchii]
MDKVNFTINGEHYSLSGIEVSSSTSLNDYIRNYLQLHGTKAMCHEGGCGACVVSVSQVHPVTKEKMVFAVNSCLVHVLSCHEWNITTVEGVGNRKDGYHPVQKRLAAFNGTQCGYCTPGWVMTMYSLYRRRKNKLTTEQVENYFGGNMCRCTGYRPILDAFKSFANDAEESIKNKILDVEDLHISKCSKKCERKCSMSEDDWCLIENPGTSLINLTVQNARWYKVFTVQDLFKVLAREGVNDYRLVAGNTGQGVYPLTSQPRVLIDISSIESLKDSLTDVNLVIGAGMPLTEVMKTFQTWAYKSKDFKYLEHFKKYLDLVAHVAVRNIGTIGGNLALKNLHHDFPSDVFLLLETVGATITIVHNNLKKSELKMQEFFNMDLKNNLITEVKLPPLTPNNLIRTYKIMPRAQNAHAIVNAGFLFKMDTSNKVIASNIVFGNISPTFNTAKGTCNILNGTKLFTDMVLQKALRKLNDEIVPKESPPETSAYCRKMIALGLFYKAVLSMSPSVNPRYKSGGTILKRSVSRGQQNFDTDKSLWPLNEPVQKLEGMTQCSGESQYACDVTLEPRAVHVAFVLSEICRGEIINIDATEALKLPGVVAFFTADDIPGKNTFIPLDCPWQEEEEEVLVSKTVAYYGQPVGVIAATSRKLAQNATKLVKVTYKKSNDKLVLTVRDALAASDKERRVREDVKVKPTDRGTDIKHVIKGSFNSSSQYHYTMEPQSCVVQNTRRGLRIRSATQWIDVVNVAVSKMLNVDENCIEVVVSQVGGAYGAKASRSSLPACACALVAYKLNRTASLVMSITDNMTVIGKRQECIFDYEVGVNDDGLIQYLDIKCYSDCGITFNDSSTADVANTLTNLYESTRWGIKAYSVLTDKASNTWCRAPGTTEAVAVVEHIMQRIAHITNKDPTDVRLRNVATKHSAIIDMVTTFKMDSEYDTRRIEIDKYNSENAWKKKALSLTVMSYPISYFWNFPVTISVYHGDGTIAISHGGIEMGQGINTKVAQVCAYALQVPLAKVTVTDTDNSVSANSMVSSSSITSDSIAFATLRACEALLERLEPVRNELNEPTWEEVIVKAFNKGIDLQSHYMMFGDQSNLTGYSVYGVCAAEVELDVLTGNHIVRRVDLLEDTGVSMSPDIDVGQIEGAFVMGLGLWTSEKLVFENSTGRLLTNRTWTYKPPGARDIPEDFRISFLRNSPNPVGVLRSKATGEPSLTLATVVTHALHDAILEARKEFGYKDTEWLHIDNPYSVENIITAIMPKTDSFKLK